MKFKFRLSTTIILLYILIVSGFTFNSAKMLVDGINFSSVIVAAESVVMCVQALLIIDNQKQKENA